MSIRLSKNIFHKEYTRTTLLFVENCIQICTKWLHYAINNGWSFKDEDIVCVGLFRDWLGLIIAIKHLYGAEMFRESQPLLRSSYEVFLQLIFFLQNSKEKGEKAICYLLASENKRLKTIQNQKKVAQAQNDTESLSILDTYEKNAKNILTKYR